MIAPRSHVLLTALGKNPQETVYRLEGREDKARMAPLALLRLLGPDERPTG